jgi:hypothetical protein
MMTTGEKTDKYLKAKADYGLNKTETTYRNLFKALLPFLKDAIAQMNHPHILRTLNEMDKCGYFETAFSANQIIWQLVSLLSKLREAPDFDLNNFQTIFAYLKKSMHDKPSLAHSLLLKFFLKRKDHFMVFDEFIEWWNLDNLRDDDYLPEKFNEVTFPALVETLYAALCKNEMNRISSATGNITPEKRNQIVALASKINALYSQYNNFKFFPYYAAKLLLSVEHRDGLLDNYLPFAQKNAGEFWVWELLADYFNDEIELRIAMLCKAMLCKGKVQMKLGVRTKLFNAFLSRNMLNEAHEELDTIIKIRNENNWKIPKELSENLEKQWYLNSVNARIAQKTYNNAAIKADEILFEGQPKDTAVIAHFNTENKTAILVTEKLKTLYVKMNKYPIKNPKEGMLIELFFDNNRQQKHPSWLKISDLKQHEKLLKTVSGKLNIYKDGQFGKVEDIFVPKHLLALVQKSAIDTYVKVSAIRSYDKKKEQWGWKAILLQ